MTLFSRKQTFPLCFKSSINYLNNFHRRAQKKRDKKKTACGSLTLQSTGLDTVYSTVYLSKLPFRTLNKYSSWYYIINNRLSTSQLHYIVNTWIKTSSLLLQEHYIHCCFLCDALSDKNITSGLVRYLSGEQSGSVCSQKIWHMEFQKEKITFCNTAKDD